MPPYRPARRPLARWLRLSLLLALLAAALPAQAAAPRAPAVNVAPVAVDDTQAAFTNEDYQDLYILDNDTDADGDTLILASVGAAAHGSVACCAASGDFYAAAYKPFAGFSGVDTFHYFVSDQHGHTDQGIVTVNVGASGNINSGRFAIYAGPQDRLTLTVTPQGGGPADAHNGACTGASGLAIEDAMLEVGNATYFNAFDNGLTFWINGNQVTPDFPLSVTHHNLASGPLTLAGFHIGLAYYGVLENYTLRSLLSISNPTGASKPVTVTVATNVGSGTFTGVRGSSSGDLNYTKADRWVVTSDDDTNPGYIVSTHVLYGPGSPAETPDGASTSVFGCQGTQGISATFHLSINANSTERLLFFNQFHDSNEAAVTDAALFNTTPVGELSGLSNNQLATVVNWDIGPIAREYLPLLNR